MTDQNWLDGRKLVAWLTDNGLAGRSCYGPAWARRLNEWEGGSLASVWKADELLVLLGLHLSEIPEDYWVTGPNPGRRGWPKEVRQAVLREYEAGESCRVLRDKYGPSTDTIKHWAGKRARR